MSKQSNKASMEMLNNLHCAVAETLMCNLDDPKVLTNAIKFLKDNEITADIIESESMLSLTDSIKQIALEAKGKDSFNVEDMLNTAQLPHL